MSTIYRTTGLAQTTVSQRCDSSALKNFWGAFQEWRKWERLRGDLCNLSDRELMDIGITRGEIDYVASNRDTDREASDPPDDVDIWQRWTVGIGHGQPRRGADADFRYGSK